MALIERPLSTDAALGIEVSEPGDGRVVIHLAGHLVAHEGGWSRSVLDSIVASTTGRLVVDCTGLVYADSGGLATLFGSQRRARSLGRDWRIRGVHGQPLSALQRSGFIDLLPIDLT